MPFCWSEPIPPPDVFADVTKVIVKEYDMQYHLYIKVRAPLHVWKEKKNLGVMWTADSGVCAPVSTLKSYERLIELPIDASEDGLKYGYSVVRVDKQYPAVYVYFAPVCVTKNPGMVVESKLHPSDKIHLVEINSFLRRIRGFYDSFYCWLEPGEDVVNVLSVFDPNESSWQDDEEVSEEQSRED